MSPSSSSMQTKRRAFLAIFTKIAAASATLNWQHVVANSATADATNLLGRWDLALKRQDGGMRSVWAFEMIEGKLTVSAIGPNPFGLSMTTIDVAPNTLALTMQGRSALGDTTLRGIIEGNKITGTWEAGSDTGELRATKRADMSTLELLLLFDRAVTTIETELFTQDRFGSEWLEAKTKARASIAAISNERALVLAVRTLLRALKVSHTGFYVLPTKVEADNVIPDGLIDARIMDDGIGYLKISSFVEGAAARARLDQAMARLKDARGLVLDLRDNTGGTLNLAMRLGDYFYPVKQTFGVFGTRQGLARVKASNIEGIDVAATKVFDGYSVDDFQVALKAAGTLAIASGGRATQPFMAPIAVLHNERCASTTEAFIATLKETKRARLFGTKTAGAMLSSAEIDVADGYVVRLGYADFRTVAGKSLEGVGVSPDEVVEKGIFGGDRAVMRAVSWLKSVKPTAEK